MKYQEIPIPSPEDIAFGKEVFCHSPSNVDQTSPIEKNIIEKIEKLQRPRVKFELALLVTGKKPACIFNFDGGIRMIIELLHLPYVIENKQIFVGKDIESFEALRDATKIEKKPEYILTLGKALGYPTTAVEGFINNELIERDELPDDIKNQRILNLIDFRLSKSHWREELDMVREQAGSIKDLVPDIYEQVNEIEPEKID